MKLQNLNVTDPEFAERFEYFAFDEVVNDKEQELPVRTRWEQPLLASLMGRRRYGCIQTDASGSA